MEKTTIEILLVDDDVPLLGVMEEILADHSDYVVHGTHRAVEALDWACHRDFDLVVTDYSLEHASIDGLEILKQAMIRRPATLGVIVTAFASLEISLKALRMGAYDFLTKPFQMDELELAVRNAVGRIRLEWENEYLREQVSVLAASLRGIGRDHADLMRQLEAQSQPLEAQSQPHDAATEGPITVLPAQSEGEVMTQAYLRIGATMGDKLDRELHRLEGLFGQGLIPE